MEFGNDESLSLHQPIATWEHPSDERMSIKFFRDGAVQQTNSDGTTRLLPARMTLDAADKLARRTGYVRK